MTLEKAVPRDLVHTREIRCRGYRRHDGLWDVEGTLEDTKAYSFANRDRDGIAAGEPIHRMHVRLTIDDDLTVRDARAVTEAGPFSICGDVTPVFGSLIGLRIGPGWRRAVQARMDGTRGCTHLTDLLLGPLTTTILQTVARARARRQTPGGTGEKPALIDSCHALASDGPIVAREWPAFHRGGK
jgi:hypothetical protein